MKRTWLLAGVALCSFLYTSCKTTAENSLTVQGANPADYFVGNNGLDAKIKMQNIQRRQNNGLLEVQVDLFNATGSDLSVEYAFQWFDAQGFRIDSNIEHWTPATLNGKHVQVVSGIALRPEAEKFKLIVRNPQEVTR